MIWNVERYINLFTYGIIVSLIFSCKDMSLNNTSRDVEKNVTIPALPSSISFAGETVPMYRRDVQEALDYDLIKNMYHHSHIILILKRSRRDFPIIEKILKEENIPEDFKYLAVAESGLEANITSPAEAKGYWQFLKGTGEEYGLEINEQVDERAHIEKSTRAAAKFLKMLKDSTGSWSLAAASYNTGLGNLRKAMREQNFEKNQTYYDLELHPETQRYLYRILALKIIIKNPD